MRFFFVFLLPFFAAALAAQDTLTIEVVRNRATEVSPLQRRKALAAETAALQSRNVALNNLPRVALNAQATWQSDVFALPIENPAFRVPVVPKDQYRVAADITQRLWDGGADRFARRRIELERALAAAQVDVEAYQVRELVTDLYFRILLLQESEAIVRSTRADLERRLRQAEAQVQEGTVLRTAADQVRLQLLRNEQQLAGLQGDQNALKSVLAIWIDRTAADFVVAPVDATARESGEFRRGVAAAGMAGRLDRRPEIRLFEQQRRQLQLGRDQLALRFQPRVEAFIQGGFGRPNPFNFFETGLEPFALIGLRAQWTPLDWGRGRREAQLLTIQAQNIDVQHTALEQRLLAATARDEADEVKFRQQLEQDDRIITLQEDILRRADAQVRNGVMTMTDYLAQVSILEQARLSRKTHELQAGQAREMLRARFE
jgi:outer membrane protein TolC